MHTWTDVSAWRKEQRARLREVRQALSPAERRSLRERVLGHVQRTFPELAGLAVGFYWPIQGELDVLPLLKRHVAGGGQAALPAVVERQGPVEWRRWTPDTTLEPGVWKIPVPAARELLEPVALVVPLLGFDAACYRLGNGGGYYDRTLAALHPRPLTIGVGFELGRLETIQPQPHDLPLEVAVTEAGVHWPATAGTEDANRPDEAAAGVSSPVCYADDVASAVPAYFGTLSRDETLALLRHLQAGFRTLLERERPGNVARQRVDLRACVLLSRLLGTQGATVAPGDPAALPTSGAADRAGLLRACRDALPRVRDDALHTGLGALLALQEQVSPAASG